MNAEPNKRTAAKAATRARLIAAAQEHIRQQGELPTVAQVATAAGVSSGTFYLHFPSTEQLVAEMQADLQRELATAVEDAPLSAGLRSYVQLARKNETAIRALWPVSDAEQRGGPTRGIDVITAWLRPLVGPKVPAAWSELDSMAELLATMVEAATIRSVLVQPDEKVSDVAGDCVTLIEHVQDAVGGSNRHLTADGEDADRVMMVAGELRLTRRELDDRVARVVTMLTGHGFGPDDRVATLLHNGPAAIEVNMAAQTLGAGVVPLNTYWRTREVEHVLRQSRASGLVFHADFRSLIESIDPDLRRTLTLVPVGSSVAEESYERQLRNLAPTLVEHIPESATLSYTSGSTGMPKGIIRAERLAERRRHGLFLASLFDITSADTMVLAGPLHHAANRLFANVCRQVGAKLILLDRFDAEVLLGTIEEEQVTTVLLVPTMLYRLVKLDEATLDRYDWSSLRAIIHMGSACSIELKQQAMQRFGPIVHEYYGTTEMGGTVISPQDWLEHPGSVGRAWRADSVVRILDEEGNELPAESTGQVALLDPRRAPFQYLGEDGEPDGNPLNRDGLFVTDDLGHLDSEGFLYLAERRSAVFKSGGVAVYPTEVEAVIAAEPSVADCAVGGFADPEWGHVVVAFVQPLPGHTVDIDELRASVRTQLAHYKCPRRWIVVDHLPRDGAGKLMRAELPKQLDVEPEPSP